VRAQLVREREVSAAELARRQAAEERTQLARELHDVVAHGMSAIQVQASSARYRISSLPTEAVAEFDGIAALARASMSEMRALLAVLRNDGTESESAPQPTAGDIPQLVDWAARTGSRVELDDRLQGAELDPVLSLTVYRIVQESLSNVARHATGADTLITLERRGDTVHVEVRNAAAASEPQGSGGIADAGGHGIRGMRERVSLHGGTLEAWHTDDGGFVVRAAIPVPRS
jgi:signal transduction histidine kinase